MKGKNKIRLLFFLLTTLAIHGNAKNVNVKNISDKTYKTAEFSNWQRIDSSTVFLRRFFRWYKTKYDSLDHHIFPVATDFKNKAPYRINFKETEKYLSILQSSGFFSDNYIINYRNYFKKIDLTLQKTKQNDGTVDGLDFDPIVHSQEPESMLENLNNIRLTVVKFTANDITIKMRTQYNVNTYLLYHLKSITGKYVIDKIDFLINDKVQK
jgi:hypothetical protein